MNPYKLFEELSNSLETKKRDDNNTFVCNKENTPDYIHTIIQNVHGDSLPDDTIYEIIDQCASTIVENCNEDSDESEFSDVIYEIESDVYISDLTKWLNKRPDNVYYLTQALEESDIKDGFELLMAAQRLQICEIGNLLVNEVLSMAEELEDSEE
jgi:hypothetical protein